MSETLRAFIVIMALSVPFFLLAKKPVCHMAMDEADFLRRRNVWLGVTAFAFLTHDFWLFAFFSTILLLVLGGRDSNRFGMYLLVVFAVPPFAAEIPGFGVLNYLMNLDYPRLLSLVLLFPFYLRLRQEPDVVPFGRQFADKCLLGFLVLPLGLQAIDDTITNTLRQGVYSYLELFLPYYVASRSLRNLPAFRDVLMSFVIGVMLMAPIALFEYGRKWLLYSSLPSALGIRWEMGSYLARGNDLRAMASAGHALSLGYLMVVACGLYAYARQFLTPKKFVTLGLLVLLAGLWSPISRGPWLGALAALAVIYGTGPNPIGRSMKLLMICLPIVAAVLLSPAGEKIISVLPIVGTVDKFNEIYRQRLLDTSIEVVKLNPFFGSFTYLQLPMMQQLKTGEGIIDIVNSYLGVALTYGLVGLALYLGMFLSALRTVWRSMKLCSPGDELHLLGRTLLATLIGVMITIIGVSSINTIGTINFVVVGICLAYGELVARYTQGRVQQTMAPGGARRPPVPRHAASHPGYR
ncbi:MAG: O-antigen ligase family protein [Pseudomonadota bacterium]